jgi:branched-chain amino acid transport system ATP-binding protein
MLAGVLRPDHGRLLLRGRDVTGVAPHRFARLGIAKSFQITSLFVGMCVEENVVAAMLAHRRPIDVWSGPRTALSLRDEARQLLNLVGLDRRRDSRADELSHGEQRSLEIAVALACNPSVLLLDEPTAGMSPEETRVVMALIRRLAESRAIGLVEHKMQVVMEVSDRVVVLHHGEVIAEGTPAEVQTDPNVRDVYLGAGRRRTV